MIAFWVVLVPRWRRAGRSQPRLLPGSSWIRNTPLSLPSRGFAVSTPARLELVNVLIRLARDVERQNPERSLEFAYIRHLAELVASPGLTGTDWDVAATAALRSSERIVAKVPEQRSLPDVQPGEQGPRTPWSA